MESESQIVTTVAPADETNKTVTYKSSNPAVVTVSSKGVITAVKTGTAKITVNTSNGKTATLNKTKVAKVSVKSKKITFKAVAKGTAYITVKCGSKTQKIKVTVK